MATSVSLSVELALPGSTGLTAQSIPFAFSGDYASKAEYDINLTGSGTYVVPFATVSKAKVLVVQHVAPTSGSPAAVNLRFNGSANDALELAPGAVVAYANPNPSVGVTAISIVHTEAARVVLWLLG